MTARHEDLDRCSQALYEARRSGVPIPPLTHEFPDWGVAEGYAVQQGLVERLIADGERIVGYKLGLTSTPMQELLGVDQPDFSPIFASGVLSDGAELSVGDFIAPRVEAEIAVVLADDLHGTEVKLDLASPVEIQQRQEDPTECHSNERSRPH